MARGSTSVSARSRTSAATPQAAGRRRCGGCRASTTCGRGHDAPAAPPLDVDEAAELDLVDRRRRREVKVVPPKRGRRRRSSRRSRRRRPCGRRCHAPRVPSKNWMRMRAHCAASRRLGTESGRPRSRARSADRRVDRRPRGRAELGRRARGDGDEGRERRARRGAPGPGAAERTRRAHAVTVSSRSPRRSPAGSAPIASSWPSRSGGGRGGRPGRRGATRT